MDRMQVEDLDGFELSALRDRYAEAALQGLLADGWYLRHGDVDVTAQTAWDLANAMLRNRLEGAVVM